VSWWGALFVFVAAFIWAMMEIEIEGKDGWAAKLPTWRIENHILLDLFLGGRPLTGYHTWAFAFVFWVFHMPFLWSGTWSWRGECHVIGAELFFWVIEDFIWFVMNPHFGWSRYRREEIWWHKKWMMGLPFDYWMMSAMGLALCLLP
jgi:hypothetical protein